MAIPVAQKITPEEYLARERLADFRSEYWHGEVFAIAGAVENHELICSNLSPGTPKIVSAVGNCRVFGANMKVGVTKKRGYAYPDLTIVCGERRFYDDVRDVLMNPTAVFEVLSESTRAFDSGGKVREYSRMESLRHYVMVEQNIREVAHYARQEGGRWIFELLTGETGALLLSAIGIELPLSEIYQDIELRESETG